MTSKELVAKCREWQKTLRLRDWDVKIIRSLARDMSLYHVEGECEYTTQSRTALIRVLDPIDYPPGEWPQDDEETIAHELLHLHFAPFMKKDEPDHTTQEQAICAIASAFVSLKRQIYDLKDENSALKRKGESHAV